MAPVEGIEPPPTVLETAVLPLYYRDSLQRINESSTVNNQQACVHQNKIEVSYSNGPGQIQYTAQVTQVDVYWVYIHAGTNSTGNRSN